MWIFHFPYNQKLPDEVCCCHIVEYNKFLQFQLVQCCSLVYHFKNGNGSWSGISQGPHYYHLLLCYNTDPNITNYAWIYITRVRHGLKSWHASFTMWAFPVLTRTVEPVVIVPQLSSVSLLSIKDLLFLYFASSAFWIETRWSDLRALILTWQEVT